MISIKIECGCGQKYEFETEPADGRMPAPVACPACGIDGTEAANAALADTQNTELLAVPAAKPRLRVALASGHDSESAQAMDAPASPRRGITRLPGQIDRPQAEHEARAKISWGDSPEDVVKFLMIQGFSYKDASGLVDEMWRERAITIRKNGFIKIVIGCVLMCLPVGFWFSCARIGLIPLKLFAVTVMVGLLGRGWCSREFSW